eukprot:Rhum_TRINITY_DN18470_c0_g1::Rhum_TRINITY_DN18470_c0_g1_i1::g.167285::m.167285
MKVLCAVALCVALQHAAAEVDIEDDYGPEAKVLELTDADFERETQATTGATTGNWFVMFHAPWCGWCKRLSPEWDKLAKKMQGEIVVAKVDATANQLTSARFGIQFFPTLVFLRQGKMYKYEGAKDLAAFEAFVTAGYEKAEALPVPAEVGLIGAYWKMIVADVSQVYNDDPTMFVGAGVGSLLLGMFLAWVMVTFCGSAPSAPKKKD